MKYQNLLAFEKHLEQSAKLQLSRVFLLISTCPYERKKISEKVVSAIALREGDYHLHQEEASSGALEKHIEGLNTTTLLNGQQVLYLEAVDKLKKNGLLIIANYMANPSPFSYLLLGASPSKVLTDLYIKGKKELIVCDLSEEKPWDRKERLKHHLIRFASTAGKRLNRDALDYLLENVGLSLPSLEQEVSKLIAYLGERQDVLLKDVQVLCATEKSSTLWQMADTIIWKEILISKEGIDLSLLLPLISQLRTQLQQGLSLSIFIERGATQGEIARYFPTLRPATLEKIIPIVKLRQSRFFQKALQLLFDIELMTKNSSSEPGLILDLLMTKLNLLKQRK